MQNEESTQRHPVDVRYCCICGRTIKGKSLKDIFGNLYDESFCYDLAQEVVKHFPREQYPNIR